MATRALCVSCGLRLMCVAAHVCGSTCVLCPLLRLELLRVELHLTGWRVWWVMERLQNNVLDLRLQNKVWECDGCCVMCRCLKM